MLGCVGSHGVGSERVTHQLGSVSDCLCCETAAVGASIQGMGGGRGGRTSDELEGLGHTFFFAVRHLDGRLG